MKRNTRQPKVFISYSWSSKEHKTWVLELSKKLISDGIKVILDEWDLKEGQDKHVFMEKMITDKKINKVLVICDEKYSKKADNRAGGVGTETQIISKKVYEDTGQEKFIPVISERNDDGKPYMPSFMASRIFIDLSSDENYKNNYKKLIRNLYGKPISKKPSLGTPPSYIIEGEEEVVATHKFEQVRVAILNDKKDRNAPISDYFNEVLTSLKNFSVKPEEDEHFDDTVMKNIKKMLPLRDDFLDFMQEIFKHDDKVNLAEIHGFFEQLISFQFKPQDVSVYREIYFDNYRFFCYELFLYFITTLLNLKKYKAVSYFVNNQYSFRENNIGKLIYMGPTIFNRHVTILDDIRKERLKLNRVSLTADLVKERATKSNISFDNLIQTDLILHYITALSVPQNTIWWWFPRCSVYNSHLTTVEMFERMVYKKHFEQMKTLFDVNSKEELKNKIDTYENLSQHGTRNYRDFSYHIPKMTEALKVEKIAII